MRLSAILTLALATYTTLAAAQKSDDFRPKNADEAEKLTEDFKKLTPDSPCQTGDQACINDQFAQCVNGKFQSNSCGSPPLECVVLPLVNKPGTSITCSTEEDRKARLADARGGDPSGNGKGKGDSQDPPAENTPNDTKQPDQPKEQDPKDFRPKNADEAEKLTEDFKKLTPDSPCKDGDQACINDEFAQCVNGKFQSNSCGSPP